MHAPIPGKPQFASVQFWSSGSKYCKQFFRLANLTMAKGQIKSKGQRLASGCRYTAFEWDHHQCCLSCREKNKGDDICVTSNEKDCFICLQFIQVQKKKLKAKKMYTKKKSSKESISKEVEDSLLGNDDIQSSSVAATPKAKTSSSLTSTVANS